MSDAARVEQRWVDAAGEPPRLVQRLPDVVPDLVEEVLRAGGIAVRQLARELSLDRKRDQVLLSAVVEGALDPATVVVGCQDEPLSGRPKAF